MMIAYHGNQSEKDAVLAQLQAHHDADEIVKGVYWERGKGCAIGCTIHGSDHALYEPRFGIPEALAHLEDCIFESLSNLDAKEWPLRFMRAIPVGADLSRVQWAFLHRILTDESIAPGITHPSVKDAIASVVSLLHAWSIGEPLDESAAKAAASAADSACSTLDLAESARWASAAARSAAKAAAEAADSAWWAAASARAAAEAASCSALSATSWMSAAEAAYLKMADVLIELLEAAPIAVLV